MSDLRITRTNYITFALDCKGFQEKWRKAAVWAFACRQGVDYGRIWEYDKTNWIMFECRWYRMDSAENSESGQNPERYRHCMRGGRTHDESRSLGKPEKAGVQAEEARARRPAQTVGLIAFSSTKEIGWFVVQNRPQQLYWLLWLLLCMPKIRFLRLNLRSINFL